MQTTKRPRKPIPKMDRVKPVRTREERCYTKLDRLPVGRSGVQPRRCLKALREGSGSVDGRKRVRRVRSNALRSVKVRRVDRNVAEVSGCGRVRSPQDLSETGERETVKMADRKSELLQVARALIAKKGLADVTTNHIAQAAGISRGTLYHHFESKEAILDALVEKISAEQYERARLTAQDSTKPARERLLRTIMSLNVGTGPDTAILEHLNSPKNIVLHQKIEREMLAILPSILAPIVEDGNREGVFNTPFAYETMEMLVSYVLLVLDGGPDLDETESTRKLAALVTNVERMLGAKEGTLSELLAQIAPPPPNPSSGS